MNTKAEILALLEQNRGNAVSGEEISEKLGISRAAVCKAVGILRREGHAIFARNRSGYTLSADSPALSPAGVEKYLSRRGLSIEVRAEVSSTNTVLRQAAEDGAPEGSILLAAAQNAGRGRCGKTFHSPKGTGLYMSILLRPALSASASLSITTAAAVAVAEAIESLCGVETKIKWVNDIYIDGRKVCGILTEGALDLESGGLRYAVLGIGVNLLPPAGGFPDEIKEIAGALFEKTLPPDFRAKLAAEITDRFFALYENIGSSSHYAAYAKRDLLCGKEITVLQNGKALPARAEGITENFGLAVRYPDGRRQVLSGGEVSVRVKK
ncbi:MAG: biotin--[Clostridia bacterium]|nr:biotin--[acetyl-CoA-carboxylase] ligase [Clostridia bacterium]